MSSFVCAANRRWGMDVGAMLLLINGVGWIALIAVVAALVARARKTVEEQGLHQKTLSRTVSDLEREIKTLSEYFRERDAVARLSVGGSSSSKEHKTAPEGEDVFKQGTSSVRWKAVVTAGSKSGETSSAALESLLKSLSDESVRVRLGAMSALAKMGDLSAVPPLSDALEDVNDVVKKRAERALHDLTGVDLGADKQAWLRWWEKTRSGRGS